MFANRQTRLRCKIAMLAIGACVMVASAARGQFIPEPRRRTPAPPTTQRARPPEGSPEFWSVPEKEIPAVLHLGSFQSEIVNKPVSYIYYLPPGYDSDRLKRYPVIYELPGLGGDCRECNRMLAKFDDAIRVGACPPVIVIGVQGIFGSFFTDAKSGKRPVESVIIKELIPHIDATFRTLARPGSRGIEGFSMGGYGAAHLAFKFPDLFGCVSMLSAPMGTLKAFQEEMPDFATDVWSDDKDYFDENDPYLLVSRNVEKIKKNKMHIRIFCGSDDRYRVFADDLHDLLTWLDVDHEFKIVPGAKRNLGQLLAPIGDQVFPFWKNTLAGNAPGK